MMELILFIYGTALGSFFNVIGLRVPKGMSIAAPRSECPNCGHKLTPQELIPVLSYIFLKGSCRRCRAQISPVYPVMELITGFLFAGAGIMVGWNQELIAALTIISLFMIITVSDLAYMIIPDKVLLVFGGFLFVERVFIPLTPWWDPFIGAPSGLLLLLLIAVVSRGGMGGGDIKLFAVIGLAVGFKIMLLSFLFSVFLGAVFGIMGMLLRVVGRDQPVPFGPFIALGTLAAYFFGEEIAGIYLNML